MESRKMVLMNLFARQQWRNIENRLMDMGRGKERVRCMGEYHGNLITICKIDSLWEFAVCLRELCINLEGWDGEAGSRGEAGSGRKGHMYTYG